MRRLLPPILVWSVAVVYLTAACGCGSFRRVEKKTHTVDQFRALTADQVHDLSRSSPYLKVHMCDGTLYVLSHWEAPGGGGMVTGTGSLYDVARTQIDTGTFTVGVDSVALFETNVVSTSPVAAILVFMGVVTVAGAIYCLTHEKSCFGSCPTFYVVGADTLRPRAEGFSSSIAPSLEKSDIDDLRMHARGGDAIAVEMRNEAYETHVVRRVDLLAVPRPPGRRVLVAADGSFWSAGGLIAPSAARGPEGDCTALLVESDGRERFSEADSTDLRAAEFVDLEFEDTPPGRAGVVIECRQTLLTTYLLYQTFAYMGSDAGHWLAEVERGRVSISDGFITDYLGCIGVQVADATGQFVDAGSVCEYGPIASDVHLIPLGDGARNTARVRLVMTRGNWRIDRVALASLDRTVTPVVVRPALVTHEGARDDDARAALLDSSRVLTTFPGDRYTLHYDLPGESEYDLFLDAQGYYLEWIRQSWIEEQDPAALLEMFSAPDRAMTRLAPEFKRVEGEMEQQFWSSRYERR